MRWFIPVAVLGLGAILLWMTWTPLTTLVGDEAALREWVEGLGLWGPLAIIGLSVLQVLVAPIPGYPIVFVSGILFGGWWGAIYANAGLMLSGVLAAALARRYGRPLAERFVERAELGRIEPLLENDSTWFWFFVLLLPTGDLPCFAAGLSRISMGRFFLALFAARFPFTFVLTHAAAQATTLSSRTLLVITVPVAIAGGLAYWQQTRIQGWMHRWLERFSHNRRGAQEKQET